MSKSLRCAASLAVLILATGAAQAPAPARLTPAAAVTARSQVLADPALPGGAAAEELAKAGYVREEFFLSGKANVYGYAPGGGIKVETPNVPYTTRLLVIRPNDPAKFSGNVQLNPLHPINGMGVWGSVKDYVLAHGDAYVGVMVGGDDTSRAASKPGAPVSAPLVLKWFDPIRYGPLNWPDEDGIRWDVFAQAAAAVHRAGGPLGSLKVTHVYASGWSFTGSFLRTFINEGFHDAARLPGGKPMIDGYLIGISSFTYKSGYTPINSHVPNPSVEDPRRVNRPIDVPVIEMMSENEAITNRDPQTPDSDAKGHQHRLYEVPGLTHGSGGAGGPNVLQQQIVAKGLAAAGAPAPGGPGPDACPYQRTDVDMSHYGQQALANLDRWVRDGTPPPHVPRLKQDAQFHQVPDAQGNAEGGLRPAQLDVPLARYGDPPGGACAPRQGLGSPALQMRRMPLSAEVLAKLYPGGAADYLKAFDADVDRMVAGKLLWPADATLEKAQARAAAKAAFGS